ncbi:MAG: FdtA/QdtA family cupin domain-containing protein, partial [Bacteroidales bacterium]
MLLSRAGPALKRSQRIKPRGSARLIELPVRSDPRGDLTFVEGSTHLPFDIRRVYYLYNVPVDAERGGHAHKVLQQIV